MRKSYNKHQEETTTGDQTNSTSGKKGEGFSSPPKVSSLACVSWNCQGIGGTLTGQRIREFRKRIAPAILFLMETKNQDEAIFPLFQNSDLSNHFTVPPIGLAGGLSLSWRDDIQVEILYSSANIIDTHISALGSSSFVSFIYGAPNPADRPKFWNKLTELGAERNEAWLLTGDFNDLLDNSEKIGGPARWEGSFLSFRNFVSQMGFMGSPTLREPLIMARDKI